MFERKFINRKESKERWNKAGLANEMLKQQKHYVIQWYKYYESRAPESKCIWLKRYAPTFLHGPDLVELSIWLSPYHQQIRIKGQKGLAKTCPRMANHAVCTYTYIYETKTYLFKLLKVLGIQFIIDLGDKCSLHLIQFVPFNAFKPGVSLKITRPTS